MGIKQVLTLFLAVSMVADSMVGTWKLNVAKSNFGSGPVYKSILVKIEVQGGSIRYVVDSVPARGETFHYYFTVNYDGKDYPVIGYPSADTVTPNRVDANTVDLVFKKGGQEVVRRREMISNGGRTRTVTTKAKDSTGRDILSITVFDKQ